MEGRLRNTKVYTYDEDLIQDLDYEYSYEETGNWIKRIESNNGRLTYITVREIEYR